MTAYEDIQAVNWSTLKSLRVSPLQYRHDLERPRDPTPAMRMGVAIHMLALEPERFDAAYAVWDGHRRGKAWTEFRDDHADRYILTREEYERAHAAAAAVVTHPLARRHIIRADLETERVLTWTDPETGLPCKGRCDLAGPRLAELKSTGDLTPHRFGAMAARLGYHGQLAFYEDGLRANGFEITDSPVLIAVQQDAPHDVAVYTVPHDVVDMGRRLYRRLLRLLRDCIEADSWPGLCTDEELTLWLPPWADGDPDEAEPTFTMGGVELSI